MSSTFRAAVRFEDNAIGTFDVTADNAEDARLIILTELDTAKTVVVLCNPIRVEGEE